MLINNLCKHNTNSFKINTSNKTQTARGTDSILLFVSFASGLMLYTFCFEKTAFPVFPYLFVAGIVLIVLSTSVIGVYLIPVVFSVFGILCGAAARERRLVFPPGREETLSFLLAAIQLAALFLSATLGMRSSSVLLLEHQRSGQRIKQSLLCCFEELLILVTAVGLTWSARMFGI